MTAGMSRLHGLCGWLLTHVCMCDTQRQLEAIGLIPQEQNVDLFLLSWSLAEEQKLFALREPECGHSIAALSCVCP